MKNHLNMNQPKTKPDTKRSEYHLSENEPILKISGLTCQCIARKSNISINIYDKSANVGIFWKFGTIIYRTGRTGYGRRHFFHFSIISHSFSGCRFFLYLLGVCPNCFLNAVLK